MTYYNVIAPCTPLYEPVQKALILRKVNVTNEALDSALPRNSFTAPK